MRLAFLDLPDDRVDLISLACASSRIRIVFVAHTRPDALALQMAERLEIPRSTEPLDLLALKPDRVALPSHETPSAAALARAGISPRIFTTLDELAVALTSGADSGENGEPERLESWELLPEESEAELPAAARLPGAPAPADGAKPSPFQTIEETMARAQDRDGILRAILDRAMERTGADGGSLMLLDPERDELRIGAAVGLSDACVRGARQKLGKGIAGAVAQTGEPRILHDRLPDGMDSALRRERSRIRAAMSAPIVLGDRVLGVLNVSTDRPEMGFTQSDLHALNEVGAQAARILERVLLETSRDGEAEEFRSLRAIEQASAASPEDRWREAASRLRRLLRADRAVLYRLDAAGERFTVFEAGSGTVSEATLPITLAGLAARVVQIGMPLFLETPLDLEGSGRAAEPLTLALVPILDGGRARGVLELGWERFPESRDLIDTVRLATRLGVALGARPEEAGGRGDAKRAALWARLADITPRLIVSDDFGSLLLESIAALRDLFGAGHFTVRLKDDRGEVHVRNAFDGLEEERSWLAATEREWGERTLEDGEERIDAPGGAGSTTSPAPWYAIVPIRLGERSVGTLSVVLGAPDPSERGEAKRRIGEDELEILRKVALYVALAASRTFARGHGELESAKDALTGLLGCPGLEARVLEEVKRVERYHDRFLLTFCSIPGLSRLKDRHGPIWADALVREFGLALAKNVREVDAVARIGGGRFAVLSPETDKNGGALLQRLDQILPSLESVRSLSDPGEIRLVGRQYSYPDEIPTGGEVLALIRSSYAPE